MKKRELKIARGYDPKTQKQVGLFAAQLDVQLKDIRELIKDMTPEQLEWQPKPGMNSIGMLLAHSALVEVWWIKAAPAGLPWEPDGKKLIQTTCGIEDDGMPLGPDGVHPAYLKGFTAEKYVEILTKARRAGNGVMKKWHDKDLHKLYKAVGNQYSYAWTLFHVVEHTIGHAGQMLVLIHLMRDAGVLPKKEQASA